MQWVLSYSWSSEMKLPLGTDLCERYFQSTFDEGQDAIAFGWQKHIIVEPHPLTAYHGMRASWSIYKEPPIAGPSYSWGDSLPAYQGSTQVMPSVVMVQAMEPRKNLYKHLHYFVLLWTHHRTVWAMVRVDPEADGTHKLAKLHVVNGEMLLGVKLR
jgi:hypothetical protein